jgi:selenide,water dikinase
MGASPFLALNIAALPTDLDAQIVQDILRGGAEKVREAGAVIAGGHTIQDKEPKYGLVAAGRVALATLMSKGGARPGDALVLTKPLGTGVITTALKRGLARPEHVAEAVEWMQALNREASQVAVRHALRGATDVTGFGLLGHAQEMASSSGVGLELNAPGIPLLSGALGYADAGMFPGGSVDNHTHFSPGVEFDREIPQPWQMLLFDAQTSGGLLLAVPPAALAGLLAALKAAGSAGWHIGWVTSGSGIRVLRTPGRPA